MLIPPQRIRGHDAHEVSTGDMHPDLHERGCLPGVSDDAPAHRGRELSPTSWGREYARSIWDSSVRKTCFFIHPNAFVYQYDRLLCF